MSTKDRFPGTLELLMPDTSVTFAVLFNGVDPNLLATHALRRGFATSAINKGVRRSLVREHGGWKTDAMLDR
jgi:hypothetical protein